MPNHLTHWRWKKGHSGNPAGSSYVARMFAREIRQRSNDGEELLAYLFGCIRDPNCHEAIRFKAAELLLKYGWGEPKIVDPAEDTDSLDVKAVVDQMSPEEQAQLSKIMDDAKDRAKKAALDQARQELDLLEHSDGEQTS